MTILEYQPPTLGNRAEHRRIIREMGRGVVPINPITRACIEIAATAAGCGVWIALCIGVARWLMGA